MKTSVDFKRAYKIIGTWFVLAVSLFFLNSCKDNSTTPSTPEIVGGVYSINSTPFGKSYSDWAVAWWQWSYSIPVDDGTGKNNHPLFDTVGTNWAVGQDLTGPVIFLGGVFNESGKAVRNCTIPYGKGIFFPLINTENDTVGRTYNANTQKLIDEANVNMNSVLDLTCTIDGAPVADPVGHRVTPKVFNYTFPVNNIYKAFGMDLPAGTVYNAVSLGYYLMLEPLSKGTHSIHFHGKIGTTNFVLDITYNLTIQ